ncbi:hypothetical protein [Bacteroides acidifaciens]|uniref:hypothetical protein n=1 Tax=Bacteroides acidifaciens TaxID=85831 RepID=UPI0030147BB8
MELKEFELFLNGAAMKFGDIVIDKCTAKKETDNNKMRLYLFTKSLFEFSSVIIL